MEKNSFIDLLFERAKARGLEELEVFINRKEELTISVFEGELETYKLSEEEVLSLRGIYENRMGYSYLEKLQESSIYELLDNLIQYARVNEEEADQLASELEFKDEILALSLEEYSQADKLSYVLDLEKKALAYNPAIKSLSRCSYRELKDSLLIKNNLGLELSSTSSRGFLSLGVIAQEDGAMETGYSHLIIDDLKEAYKDELMERAAGDALAMLGAGPLSPRKIRVILRNNVASDLMANFLSMFYATSVQDKLSPLEGRLGSVLASELISMKEDPRLRRGKVYRGFDDEASLAEEKTLIDRGRLLSFFHNRKTAKKAGLKSTANGFKPSHKASIEVATTNVFFEKGDKSLEELMELMEEGLVVTEIHGLHAGINPVSGDFSLSANGLLVEEGRVVRPISKITLAGNLLSMLGEVQGLGSDLIFSNPASVYFGSPSLYVGELDISGK